MSAVPTNPPAVQSDIETYLPHRKPFLFVDTVDIVEGEILATRTYPSDEFFFAGHFPEYPVVPGVILVETMAQCGGVGVKKMGINPAGTFMFAKIREARFRRQVRPGETLTMKIRNVKASANIIHQKGEGYVGEELAVEAEWIAIVGGSYG